MINADYKEVIAPKERLLQNYIGRNISPKIRLDGFVFDTDGTIDSRHSTPVRCKLITTLISADTTGDDSTESWMRADGPKAVADFLDRNDLADGTVKWSAPAYNL